MKRQVAILTPPGRSAIATLICRGENVDAAVSEFFTPMAHRDFSHYHIGQIVFGSWTQPSGQSEDVVVCRKSESTVEVNCHGGTAAVDAIESNLKSKGFESITWKQWLDSGDLDSIRRKAAELLVACSTLPTSLHMLDQQYGALSEELCAISGLLVDGAVNEAKTRLHYLNDSSSVGLHLVKPFDVVIAGLPNAGKSSLLNQILGYDRAIVAEISGTTRDVLADVTAINGWPVSLRDTAGIRESDESIEQQGIHKSYDQVAKCDLVVWVDAINQDWVEPPVDLSDSTLFVFNKSDLLSESQIDVALRSRPAGVVISAVSGEGLNDLLQQIITSLLPAMPVTGQPLLFTEGQKSNVIDWLTMLESDHRDTVIQQITALLSS